MSQVIDTKKMYRVIDRVMLTEDGEEAVAFDPETLAIHQLNPSLAFIVKSLNGSCSCEQLVARLVENYNLDVREAATQTYHALELLDRHELLEVVS